MDSKRTPTLIAGIFIGVAICAAFWAGHTFWPGSEASSPSPLTSTSPAEGAITVLPKPPAHFLVMAENTIADIAKQASDSVVNIDISSSVVATDFAFPSPFPFNDFDFFFG